LTDDGKNSTLWPSFSVDYYLQTLTFDERSYTRFTLMDESEELNEDLHQNLHQELDEKQEYA